MILKVTHLERGHKTADCRGIAAGGIVNAGYILGVAVKKEKPRLRYLRGQWMTITDRREQYHAKRKALDESVDLMFSDPKLQDNAGEFYGMSLHHIGRHLKANPHNGE